MTVLDCMSAWHQLALRKDDVGRLGIAFGRSVIAPLIASMGISAPSAHWQFCMNTLVFPYPWAEKTRAYADDVITRHLLPPGPPVLSHEFAIQVVTEALETFRRLGEYGVGIAARKVQIGVLLINGGETPLLGFSVSHGRVLAPHRRLAFLAERPLPRSVAEYKSLMAFMRAYSAFVFNGRAEGSFADLERRAFAALNAHVSGPINWDRTPDAAAAMRTLMTTLPTSTIELRRSSRAYGRAWLRTRLR